VPALLAFFILLMALYPDLTVGAISFRPFGSGITGVPPTREAGGSIKPGVKRSEPQEQVVEKLFRAREAADSRIIMIDVVIAEGSPASRAGVVSGCSILGFAALHPRLYAIPCFAGFSSARRGVWGRLSRVSSAAASLR
jgi:hypothetical protein